MAYFSRLANSDSQYYQPIFVQQGQDGRKRRVIPGFPDFQPDTASDALGDTGSDGGRPEFTGIPSELAGSGSAPMDNARSNQPPDNPVIEPPLPPYNENDPRVQHPRNPVSPILPRPRYIRPGDGGGGGQQRYFRPGGPAIYSPQQPGVTVGSPGDDFSYLRRPQEQFEEGPDTSQYYTPRKYDRFGKGWGESSPYARYAR